MIFLGVGSNLGDRWAILDRAWQLLEARGIAVVQASPVYETLPWGEVEQPLYLNAVWAVETSLAPRALLRACQEIEAQLGRPKTLRPKWGARPIDIDILAYGELVCQETDLILPHPWIPHRPFVLGPWKDIAPYFYLVPWQKTVGELWQRWAASSWGQPATPPPTLTPLRILPPPIP